MAMPTVTKSNDLIEASYRLTLQEQRLLLCCIAQLDPRKPMPHRALRVTASQFADSFDVPEHKAYEYLNEAADRIFDREIRTYDGRNREKIRWVEKVKYLDGEGCVELMFTATVAPYLTMLNKRFTSYQLQAVAGLRSPYSFRLYELVAQYRNLGAREIALDVLRDRLQLSDKYDRFSNLKARVLEPAVKEINGKSDILVSYRTRRKARQVTAIVFTVVEDRQMSLIA